MIYLEKPKYNFDDLVAIMDKLRGPGGCPWDIEQDHASIRRNFIEEVYEACEAIDEKDNVLLCEELGDVMLQVVFHAHIARQEGAFDLDDVCDGICRKLILRHPHIFGDVKADTAEQVLKNWDEIKKQEKQQKTYTQTMEDVAKSLPALIYAEKVQKRAKKVGFDWPDVSGALEKVHEEADELQQALQNGSNVEEELGDLLFAAVNVARFAKVDPEEALVNATRKFIRRFAKMEQMAGDSLSGMTLEEMDKLWDAAKQCE